MSEDKLSVSLIDKLEAISYVANAQSNSAQEVVPLDKAIAIVRTHKPAPAPDVVERVARAINLAMLPTDGSHPGDLAKAAIAAMADASTRKDEGNIGTTVATSANILANSPANTSEVSVDDQIKTLRAENELLRKLFDDASMAAFRATSALLDAKEPKHGTAHVADDGTVSIIPNSPEPVMVSLDEMVDVFKTGLGITEGVKAVLDAAGVKYVD